MKNLFCASIALFFGLSAFAQTADTTHKAPAASATFDAGALLKPLYVVDGKIYGGSINNLNTNDIKSITVLQSHDLVKRYGPGAVNGVIMVETGTHKSYLPMQPQSKTFQTALPDSITYVVDGVVSESKLGGIDPQDIESIRVVKNNTTTPVIGVAGGSVIMVTTKEGAAKQYKQQLSAVSPGYKKYLDEHNNDDSGLKYSIDGALCEGRDGLARLSNLTKDNIAKVKFAKSGTDVVITTKK